MAKLYLTDHGTKDSPKPSALFYCPGCEFPHAVIVGGSGPVVWQWNGDINNPTFSPSILVTGRIRCHSFVKDGKIQFLGDCEHRLANQTVDLPEYSWGE